MHDLLYANQSLWAVLPEPATLFDGFAEELGLDMEQFAEDLQAEEIRDKIRADQRGGTRAGVRSTPSLFVNGRLVPTPRTAVELESLVARELRAVSGA